MEFKGPNVGHTIGGHSFADCKSGLQKYIRRSKQIEALYCYIQLDLMMSLREHEAYQYKLRALNAFQTNTFHRVLYICLEDVGLANTALLAHAKHAEQIWKNGRSYRTEKEWMLVASAMLNLINCMVHSPKSRLISHLRAVYWTVPNLSSAASIMKQSTYQKLYTFLQAIELQRNTTELASDTPRAVKGMLQFKRDPLWLQRDFYCFIRCVQAGKDCAVHYLFKAHYSNEKAGRHCRHFKPAYLYWQYMLWRCDHGDSYYKEAIEALYDWYTKNQNREQMLFLIYAGLLLIRTPFLIDTAFSSEPAEKKTPESCKQLYHIISQQPMRLDDYVFDQHTTAGRAMGRKRAHFVNVGAFVTPAAPQSPNDKLAQKIYELVSILQPATQSKKRRVA